MSDLKLRLGANRAAKLPPMSSVTLSALSDSSQADLTRRIRGGVSFEPVIRGLHATDASLYQQTPQVVVTPVDVDDCLEAMRWAHAHQVAITPRGGATSLSGQTFGPGMVLDLSKHMDGVLEVNHAEQWVRVQPGVIRDRLNAQLKPGGLHFSPDPATANRATLGGMIGNNTSGTKSVVFGKTIDQVLECKIALADGTVLDCKPMTRTQWAEVAAGQGRDAEIYRGVQSLVERHETAIRERYPKVFRRVSGYNLDEFVDGAGYQGPIGDRDHSPARLWNLAYLICGSEGTLATLLEAKVRLTPLPAFSAICVVHFDDLLESLRHVDRMLEHRPSTVELLDSDVMDEARVNPATRHMAYFIQGQPRAVQLCEFFGDTQVQARDRAQAFARAMQSQGIGVAWPVHEDPKEQADIWSTRKLGLGLISNVKGAVKGRDFIEDACVPTDKLADYIEKIQSLCKSHGIDRLSLYAHASVGVVHVVPALDLHKPEAVDTMAAIADQAFQWVMGYGGSWSGEHGDGQLRGKFLPRMFGDDVYSAFRELKALFDPQGLMNPGKVVDAPPMTQDLRYQQPGYNQRIAEIKPHYHYREQGGFSLAVEQCNGVGACRKLDSGTMCPSFMATRDEKDSTRGRANALRLAMSGQLGEDPMTALGGDDVKGVLDLCLSCKACKSECPNMVDMAKLKSDTLQMRHDQHGTSRGAKALGRMPDQAKTFAGPLAWIPAAAAKLPGMRVLMEKLIHIDRRRPLPAFTSNPLSNQLEKRHVNEATSHASMDSANGSKPRVMLFDDTYVNYMEPHVGLAAIDLLEGLGYEVVLANAGCCQRPRLSKGLVREGKTHGTKTLENLDVFASQGLPILCLEPSCASALADDLPDLIDDAELGQRVAKQIKMLDVFLAEQAVSRGLTLESDATHVLLHGHCHQKALFGTEGIKQLFAAIPGVQCHEVDSGCCGMAGSFGYEHYDLSKKIYEDRLGPAVRDAIRKGETVVACGISCRHQMHDLEGVTAKHFVEVVRPAANRKSTASAEPLAHASV